MMNVENINKVADAIEQYSIRGLGFNMGALVESSIRYPDRSGHDCGTTACIAGWALFLSLRRKRVAPIHVPVMWRARKWLDLTEDQADNLFTFDGLLRTNKGATYDDFLNTTPSQAVAVLRYLAATGEVDWSIAASAPSTEKGDG